MKQPIIFFDHYMLRDVELKDTVDMYEYGKDMEVVKYLSWGPYNDITEASYSIKEFFLSRPKRGLPVGYAIVDLQTNKMIGTVDFHTIHPNNTVEVGYVLHKDYWNKGVMTKALRKLLEVGFYYHKFDKIIIGHANKNLASKRVIEKNGFIFEREDLETYYDRFNGVYEPASWYYLRREDFK
jgi:ribosomal-protein-alanine N-acetyltransferase